jgi:hypothetical protein
LVEEDVSKFGFECSVNALERFPIFQVDGEWLLPIDPAYVVRRSFGWPTYWDVMNGNINKAARHKFDSAIRNAAERYISEFSGTSAAIPIASIWMRCCGRDWVCRRTRWQTLPSITAMPGW